MKTKITSAKFEAFEEMSQSAKNWDHHCSYRLLPHAFEGEHHVIELPHTQLSYSYREGGFMHDAKSPPDSVSIAVIQTCADIACFDRFKLREGMILFFDDSQSFNFMSKGEIRAAIISIPNTLISQHKLDFRKIFGKYVFDENAQFSALFDKTLEAFLDTDEGFDIQEAEKIFIEYVKHLIETSSLHETKLTKGEEIALTVRNQVYHHMDGKINIESFAKQYKVSVKTLENAFKSLFGFTPKKFLQLLKLNLVHHDLQKYNPKTITVQAIASKWGFAHMGRFAKAYTELFSEKPSETLIKRKLLEENMTIECISRKDEMT